jgi:hypothetical protein
MSMDPMNDLEPHQIFAGLEKIIQEQDKRGKDQSKTKEKENKEFAKCFKIMQSIVVMVMYVWDHKEYHKAFFPDMLLSEKVK